MGVFPNSNTVQVYTNTLSYCLEDTEISNQKFVYIQIGTGEANNFLLLPVNASTNIAETRFKFNEISSGSRRPKFLFKFLRTNI